MSALAGVRVLVTRARGQASSLAELLTARGAEAILIPSIELAPPASYCALDAALTTLRSFDWLLFTSANAVHAFVQRARLLRLQPDPRRIAVIGPATASAVVASGLAAQVDLMPGKYVAEALAGALSEHAKAASMLLVCAAEARDVLPRMLTESGASLTVAEAYRNVVPQDSVDQISALCCQQPPDAITFTSASTARNLKQLLEHAGLKLPQQCVLASIGPVTSQAMQELGMPATLEAESATIASLIDALDRYFSLTG